MTQTVTNDITTRLLAQENLLIDRAPVRTASFDVKNRVLILPQWQNMTPEIEECLKAHEVAHALFTDQEIFKARMSSENKDGIPFSYLNIIEDARIERLMKNQYPGLRRVFNEGYNQLVERDFFKVRGVDLTKLTLIDRVNLYFKAGYKIGVKFTTAEKVLVDRVAAAATIDDVVDVARDIYDITKQQVQQRKKALENDDEFKKMIQESLTDTQADVIIIDEEDEDDYEDYGLPTMDGGDEGDGYAVDGEGEPTKNTGRGSLNEERTDPDADQQEPNSINWDELVESTTAKALEENLSAAADTSTSYNYMALPNMSGFTDEFIVPYTEVLARNENAIEEICDRNMKQGYDHRVTYWRDHHRAAINDYQQFSVETNKVVSYLVKEFEMKKAATAYKRQTVAKTGVLDVAKLASFKIREDLFKQVTITKDGQKHGMMFILDWSGSMDSYLVETVKQLISLVQFCHRAHIPFQVFAFSDTPDLYSPLVKDEFGYENNDTRERDALTQRILAQSEGKTVQMSSRFSMIEFFNHKMKPSELSRMSKTLFMMAHRICSANYNTHGTPLNEALIWTYHHMEKFMRVNQVEKCTLIKLTDGDGGNMHYYHGAKDRVDANGERVIDNIRDVTYEWTDGKYQRVAYVHYIRDAATSKTYQVFGDSAKTVWGNVLTEMIRDRHNCATIGFHVTYTASRMLAYALKSYGLNYSNDDVYVARRALLKDQFAPIKVQGHSELFLLRDTIKVEEGTLASDMTKMTAAAIARNFTKTMSGKKTSRVLLNRFVSIVA